MKYQKYTIITLSSMLFLSAGVQAYSAVKPKAAAIKPAANQAIQSDEQQGVAAVRKGKAAVVSIVGTLKDVANPNAGISQDAGTGFIVDSTGYIVSNRHVIANASLSYTVVFGEGQTYDAKVVGIDKLNDIALLKIDAQNLPALKFGDSGALETGQSVFAIGNSLGRYQNTVTRGVVSGLGRTVSVNNPGVTLPRYQNLIQTDASINPGNSGGPLINLNGEVIGMNTLIDTGGQGLGFAVPAKVVADSITKIKTSGVVARPFLGINFLTVNKNLAALHKFSSTGSLVTLLVANGPAEKSGLQVGDIVTAINNEPLTERNELDLVVQKYSPGTKVTLSVDRQGAAMTVDVTLGEYK